MGGDLHGVSKFSQVVLVVSWYLQLRFGRVAEVGLSPRLDFMGGGGIFLPGITNIYTYI